MLSAIMILSLLFSAVKSQATVADSRTIVSITRFNSMVDIRVLPSLLHQEAGYITDPNMVSFFRSTEVKTLRHIKTQVVWTSIGDIDSGKLCDFIRNASLLLPSMVATCSENFAAEKSSGHVYANDLHVNDPGARRQCQLKRLRMREVWDLIDQYSLRDVSVAIIDTGIDFTDPELSYARGTFQKSNGDILNGSWNTVYNSPSSYFTDDHGHNIARVMAARVNNSFGIAGIASNLKLMGIQMCNKKGDLSTAALLEGMDLAIDIGVDVVSVSIGTLYDYQQALEEMERKKIIVVASAGNEGLYDSGQYPCAAKSLSNIICVGALSGYSDYALRQDSNYGPQVHIAAFGTDVIVKYNGWYHRWMSGTSFAVPFVTGTVGILLGLGIQPDDIRPLLMRYAFFLDRSSHKINPDGGALNILETIEGAISEARLRKKDVYRLQ